MALSGASLNCVNALLALKRRFKVLLFDQSKARVHYFGTPGIRIAFGINKGISMNKPVL